nr:MAG TPA: hypothetical protein [Caudoviricetes sp.]
MASACCWWTAIRRVTPRSTSALYLTPAARPTCSTAARPTTRT